MCAAAADRRSVAAAASPGHCRSRLATGSLPLALPGAALRHRRRAAALLRLRARSLAQDAWAAFFAARLLAALSLPPPRRPPILEYHAASAPLRVQVAGRSLSTLQLPHRAYDAILRDSSLAGQSFRKTDVGRAIIAASPADASALLRHDPAVLLFGGWDSTGLHGSSGNERRWPAAVSVEIYGSNALPIQRAGGRIDPLGITLDAGPVISDGDSYRLVGEGEKPPKGALRPSEINHGNIAPSLATKGVLVEDIRLAGALSLSRLRRYHFGGDAGHDVAARTALALMGLYGIAAVIDDGLDLRRDCELVAETISWAIRGSGRAEPLQVSLADARDALRRALADIPLAEPLLFKADDNLEQLVARSH